jgi:gamma-glutamylcyclotransferase (GGCT)/AIG2-like uncharacterized protein YtfP
VIPLFVYGTLMTGGGQEHLIGPSKRTEAVATGTLYRMAAGYPAMGAGVGPVHGELVEGVSDEVLTLLDRYEGVSEGLYARLTVDVRGRIGVVRAWCYVMSDPEARGGIRIPSGRWRSVTRR